MQVGLNTGELIEKARCVRCETLRIHKTAQETRVASSLSAVEIFTVLYYGGVLQYDPENERWDGRDRFIISKGHGAISLYPILADVGYFPRSELEHVCKEGSFLGGIPDPIIPGFETINGSLGHGPGVACGIAIAMKRRKKEEKVFVLVGDGELYEGSIWEAVMFAGMQKLDNLMMIVDCNKVSMLDTCKNIIDLEPLDAKFSAFGWDVKRIDGHSIEELREVFMSFKNRDFSSKPVVLIADTVKGKGVPRLEVDPLSHIKNLNAEEIDSLLENLQ